MNETLLEVKEISKHFGGVKALDKVNLSIKKGKSIVWSGKTAVENPR